jgi:hypothetical protein
MPFLAVEKMVKNSAEKETPIYDRKVYYKIQGHWLFESVTRLVSLCSVQYKDLVPPPIRQRERQVLLTFPGARHFAALSGYVFYRLKYVSQ